MKSPPSGYKFPLFGVARVAVKDLSKIYIFFFFVIFVLYLFFYLFPLLFVLYETSSCLAFKKWLLFSYLKIFFYYFCKSQISAIFFNILSHILWIRFYVKRIITFLSKFQCEITGRNWNNIKFELTGTRLFVTKRDIILRCNVLHNTEV